MGLDIGISSVGFGICDLAEKKIEHSGVHLFERPEVPKTGYLWPLKDRQSGDKEGKFSASDSVETKLDCSWRSLGFQQKSYPQLYLKRILEIASIKHFGTFVQKLLSDISLTMN